MAPLCLRSQTLSFAAAQTTVPANGLSNPTGVAVDAAGDVFIADSTNGRVVKVPWTGSGYGTQITVGSGLFSPQAVAVDSAGDVFIGDHALRQVVKVPAGGGAQSTVASGLSRPAAVAVDAAGDLFIANRNTGAVVEVQRSFAVNSGDANICPAGQTSPAPCSQTMTLAYNVTASGMLGTVNVLTQGAQNLDFSLAGSTCAGDVTEGSTCTVYVTFAPRFAGQSRGAVQIADSSGNVLATTFIYGTGLGPQIAWIGGTNDRPRQRTECALRCGGGRSGQWFHRGPHQQPCGESFPKRRPDHRGQRIERPLWRGGGRGGRCLHRGCRQQPRGGSFPEWRPDHGACQRIV